MDEQGWSGRDPVVRKRFVVVAGYGLPGRVLVDLLRQKGVEFRVIELNPDSCARVAAGGTPIIQGDASDPEVLRKAEIERATMVALMVPNDEVNLKATEHVHRMNPSAIIIARCAFTSNGLEMVMKGATVPIVAEQAVAREAASAMERLLPG